jgi:large subunit ribosomal protein L3
MSKGLLGKKLGMTQIFTGKGEALPATVIEAGPCFVLQIKTEDKEGYNAVQLGFDKQKKQRVNKPLLGKFKKAKVEPLKIIKEFRISQKEQNNYKVGNKIGVDIFEIGEYVDITGTSIGKGFQGVMKRFGFKGHPASHGSTVHRSPGSIGASATPSRVTKGKRLPGRQGGKTVTVEKSEILDVDIENNLIVIKGSVPGSKGNYLVIEKSMKKPYKAKPEEEKQAEAKQQQPKAEKEDKKQEEVEPKKEQKKEEPKKKENPKEQVRQKQ